LGFYENNPKFSTEGVDYEKSQYKMAFLYGHRFLVSAATQKIKQQ